MIRVLALLEADHVTGPAKNLLALARQFQTTGRAVEIQIATFHRGRPDNDLTRAVESAGLVLHRIAERYPFDLRVLSHLRAAYAAANPHILQTHSLKSHFLMRLGGEWRRRPWIAFHHGYTLTGRRLRLYNRLDRWSLRAPHQVVVVSQAFGRDLAAAGISQDRMVVVHNAIDPAWGEQARDAALRTSARREMNLQDAEQAILIVGRLSLEKSHVLLVQAVARLRTLLPGVSVRLIIVGHGPEKAAIEQAAQACGLTAQIYFAGYSADVLPFYAAADLAVLASRSEGSPNALLEAMAAHVPVVATSVGGIPEIVSQGDTALLVPPGNVTALAAALAQALRDPGQSRAMAERAHAEILAHYTPEQRAARIFKIYDRLANNGAPAQ